MKTPSLTLLALAAFVTQARAEEAVTFNRHIAPILWKHCAGCHHAGEVGPFSLLTYKDAARRAGFLRDITASRRMPPWKAVDGFGEFRHARGLSAAEIESIARWANTGAVEGDPRDLPPRPSFPTSWQLGKPDLVLKMPEAYTIPAAGPDLWRCFVIPIPIDSDRMVSAIEFHPGNRRVVHHASLFLDTKGQARKKDRQDGKPGYDSFGGPGIVPTGGLDGWTLGARPGFLPDGAGRLLQQGSDLVLQLHYHPSGKAETDQSEVGIFFTRKPASKYVTTLVVSKNELEIPPGAKRLRVTAQSEPLPVDVTALKVGPHMHGLGREVKVTAVLPDRKVVPLVWIKSWDFHWQETYELARPLHFPKGTVIHSEVYYDNSADNPQNPNHPPRLVRWGTNLSDEMMVSMLEVMTSSLADMRAIEATRGMPRGTSQRTEKPTKP
jgi:hypothetical protein